jgi:glycerol-3-phosphate O-acyltransferase/dihydroxyacetone phosphate acyltransferase
MGSRLRAGANRGDKVLTPSTHAELRRADPPVRSPPSRAWVWGFARLAVRTFYRVERLGTTLPDGPLLLIANHPNTLLDPALLQTTAGRQIRFLAKSTLFRHRTLGVFVRNSGAIPVFRKIDPGVDTSRNAEMFVAVEAALADGEAICLFPEGISHDRGRLETLRTGAARMVLASGAKGHPVTIFPVGLNFEHVARFRSRVTTVFGRPFDGDDLVDRFATDPKSAVRALTQRMSERLRPLLV